MATLFKDLGKQANDLLNKGFFEHEKYYFKVEGTLVAQNAVKATPSVQISTDQTVAGSIKAVFPCTCGLTSTFTADLKNALKLEIASNSYFRGIFKPTLELSSNAKSLVNSAKFKQTVDIATGCGGSSVGVTYALASGVPQLNFSLVGVRKFNLGTAAIGVETDYTQGKEIPINVAASFNIPSLTATIFGNFFLNKLQGRYALSLYGPLASSPSTTIGSELVYDGDGKATQITVGGNHTIDSNSSVKAKFNSRGIFGVVYSQKIQDSLTLSVLADVNLREINNPNSAKFGVKVAL